MKLRRSMIGILGMTICGRGIAAFKDILMAHYFGPSLAVDSLIYGITILTFFLSFVQAPLLVSKLPGLINEIENGSEKSRHEYFSSWIILTAIISIILVSIYFIYSWHFVPRLNFLNGESLSLFKVIASALALSFIFQVFSALMICVLQAHRDFIASSIGSLLMPLLSIFILYFFSSQLGIFSFVWGTILGSLIELIFLVHRVLKLGYSIFPLKFHWNDRLKVSVREFLLVSLGGAAMAMVPLVDQTVAAFLGPESISLLNFGSRLSQGILTLSSVIWIVLFPHFSSLIVKKDWYRLKNEIHFSVFRVFCFFLGISLCLSLLAQPLIDLLFGHGQFNAESVQKAAQIQAIIVFQLPFYIVGTILSRVLSAFAKNKTVLVGGVLNAILSALLCRWLGRKIGLDGIALATVLTYCFSFLFLFYFVRRKMREVDYGSS